MTRRVLDVFLELIALIDSVGPDRRADLLESVADRYGLRPPLQERARVSWLEVERWVRDNGPRTPANLYKELPYDSLKQAQNAVYDLALRGRLVRLEHGLYDVPRGGENDGS